MLDYIRSNAQSFGVKVAFGVIILVFVFWGVGSFNDRNSANVVAIVNGDPILVQQFEQAYRNAEESILRNNPGVTRACSWKIRAQFVPALHCLLQHKFHIILAIR